MKIIISGGGIAGLTLALTAKKAGYIPILVQKRSSLDSPSFGGGIGLWPPSQMVMERLGILEQLQNNGMYMPSACYYNSQGHTLGHPSSDFSKKFPVLCLQREQLSKSLLSKCLKQGIQILTNTAIQTQHIESYKSGVRLKLSNNQYLDGNILIGADGIGSKVRDYIMNEQRLPKIIPYHCQYAYFRAVVNITINSKSSWHDHAFESWGERKRFGYVPLKYPFVFWFVAIPIGQSGLQKSVGSHSCSQQQKEWIKKQFQYWQSPIQIKQLIQLTPAETLLRTDICKVKDVTSFAWSSNHRNVIILGDAANATAPNLAQGAGLAIESAWDLISMVELTRQDRRGLDQYLQKRKKRATTVQTMADLVAEVGQLSKFKSSIRDFLMKNSTYYLKELEKRIFQEAVSHSVGGDSKKLYWMTRNIPLDSFQKNIRQQSCLIGKILGPQSFNKLPEKTRKFRSSLIASGKGTVNVSVSSIATLFGLPKSMNNEPFQADCETYFQKDGTFYQKWARVFGVGKQSALKYQTYHYSTPNLKIAEHGLILTESLGKGPDIFRFGYMPRVQDNTIYYESKGLWLKNYKIPIPQFMLPTSSWHQKQTPDGWEFDGTICMPKILGSFNLMKYSGIFNPQVMSRETKPNNKRVIIAGGTGLIGSHVAKTFYLKGWTVEILSRNSSKQNKLSFAKFHEWNPQQFYNQKEVKKLSQIINNSDVIINLSGENPGAGFWNQKTKTKILASRLNSIKLITSAIIKTSKPPKFLQASAAGIYGNRNQSIINDDFQPGKQQTFRVQTCKQIQQLTFQKSLNIIESSILRIGHVLSSQGGLFPHLQLASKFRAKKFGKGGQYAPWIHISDLAHSIAYIASNFDDFSGKTVNIASPNHCTYDQILGSLAKNRQRKACVIPVPEIILKKVLGQLASVLLDSQRMHPKLLVQRGFTFQYSEIDKALTSMDCL